MGAAILAHRSALNAFLRILNGPTTASGSLAAAGTALATSAVALPSGFAYRYRASDMAAPANGATVASISFQTGSLTLSSGGGTTSPTYLASGQNGKPALRFDGTNDYLSVANAPSGIGAVHSVLFALDVKTVSGAREFVYGGVDYMEINDDVANAYEIYAGNVLSGGTPSTGMHFLSSVLNGASTVGQVDGTTVLSGNAGSAAPSEFTLGTGHASSKPAQMDLYEVVVYSRALSSAELSQAYAYYQAQYGSTVTTTAPGTLAAAGSASASTRVAVAAPGTAALTGATAIAAATIPNQDIDYVSGGNTSPTVSATIPQATHVFVVPANSPSFSDYGGSSVDGGVRIYGTTNNRIQVYAGGNYLTQSNASIDFTRANIIISSYDASTGLLTTYLNGVPIGTDRREGGFTFSGAGQVRIGNFLTAYKRYTRALYGREIRQLFDQLSSQYGIALTPRVTSATNAPLTLTGLKGANQHPKNAQFSGGLGVFEQFWGAQWDWAWVQDSIDKTKLRGGTVFRIIGDVQGIKAGTITQATYTARVTQVADYLASKNMRMYYCGCDLNQRGNAVQADIVAQYVEVAKVLQAHASSTYGFDLANEIRSTYGNTPKSTSFPWMQAASAAIRQVAANVPISVSDIGGGGSDDGGSADGIVSRAACFQEYVAWAPYVDFFDIHGYEHTTGEFQPWQLAPYTAAVDRPLSIGEFGTDMSGSEDPAVSLFGRIKAIRDNTPAVTAVSIWAIRNDQYGLYKESDGSIRSSAAAAYDAI